MLEASPDLHLLLNVPPILNSSFLTTHLSLKIWISGLSAHAYALQSDFSMIRKCPDEDFAKPTGIGWLSFSIELKVFGGVPSDRVLCHSI